jgi:hypothetical protein
MMDENQLKEEIKLFKENFGGQEGFLKSIRSLLIGLDVSDEEKKRIQTVFADKVLLNIVRRRMIQQPSDDVGLGGMSDLWMQSNDKLHGASVDMITQTIKVGAKLTKYYKQVESLLSNPFGERINFNLDFDHIDESVSYSETACNLIARNLFIRSVDLVMAIISSLVKEKEETPDETVARIKKNSTK